MKLVVATEISTLILWWRASLLASPTVVPASTVPWRGIAPVRARIASSSVVLPLWNGPTSAMHRGPEALVPFCAISASLAHPRRGLLGAMGRATIVSGNRGDWQEPVSDLIRGERLWRTRPAAALTPPSERPQL